MPPASSGPNPIRADQILAIRRPHRNLLKMYFLQAAASLFAFPFVMIPLAIRYATLRYELDDEGINASWGKFFRKEIYLTYRRIQDIHVSRNIFERWLGIGKVEIQTASGSSSAELTLEGMEHFDAVRDFLYARMRGARETDQDPTDDRNELETQALEALRQIGEALDRTRVALEQRNQA